MFQLRRKDIPRLPLDGRLDLTYRCNNRCRHCWLWLPSTSPQGQEELSYEEIRRIVDEARALGCQAWGISGGEPMLRVDFIDIFDYITRKSISYKLNSNGTQITPQIASLMKRRGTNMIALYGATAEVHDQVTRTPGSFEGTLRGFAYLKEAGVAFTVQIVPMRENYHQYDKMLELAQSLSPSYRIGAPWLWLSACRSEARNHEILNQRLDPAEVLILDEPDPVSGMGELPGEIKPTYNSLGCNLDQVDDRLFAACIASRRDFHVDPYGQMSFCYFIKDPALRYDLREGSFRAAWDEFIPSLADAVRGGQEYQEQCGSCGLRQDCRWCGVYAYLEHGRYAAKIDYLCQVAEKTRQFKEDWRQSHIRYYQIAGITIRIAADFPLAEDTFAPIYEKFRIAKPGEDLVSLRLHAGLPARSDLRLGKEVYRKAPWVITQQSRSWVYQGTSSDDAAWDPNMVAIFDRKHNHGRIFHRADFYQHKNLTALSTFTSDQIWLARTLAERQACYLHSSGIILYGKGLLFVGHSDAGKSTMLKMLRGMGEILCDDRNIIRRWPEGFRVHGTWSHGELPDVSPASAPLRAILYLDQAPTNELIPLDDTRERLGRMLSHVVKPLVTGDWWEKILDLAGQAAVEVPAYRLRFDKSGQVVNLLQEL